MSALLFNVGEIVRDLNAQYPLADPPRVAPQDLIPLLDYLREVTRVTEVHIGQSIGWFLQHQNDLAPLKELYRLQAELAAWSDRLDRYELEAHACAPDDVNCALWTVTAPVFFGYYDGPNGTGPAKTPDLRTPFTIANQTNELREWSQDQLGGAAFTRDLKASAGEAWNTATDATKAAYDKMADALKSAADAAKDALGFEWWQLGLGIGIAGVVGWKLFGGKKG